MRTRLLTIIVTVLAAFFSNAAFAQAYPAKPVRVIVPFPPGGGQDFVGRVLAQKLTEQMKQQVFVENRTGAGGSIGTEAAVRSTPDGYTMVLASISEIAVNPFIYTRLTYDTVRDLAAIALVASTPIAVIVHPSLPVKNVKDLVSLAKARPGEINMGSAGSGTFTHFSGELFKSLTGVNLTHVPYKGGAPMIADLASGQVQVIFSALSTAVGLLNAGKIRVIAISTAQRIATLPEVPTVIESGVPGYELVQWYGMFVPAATPKEIVGQLHSEIAQALRLPDVIANFAKQGATPGVRSQQQVADFVRSEVAKWGKVAKASGVKLD